MNTTVVIMYQPFVIEQMVIIYQNGEIIETKKVNIEEIPFLMRDYSSKYGISNINLIGNQDYLGRFQNEIKAKVPSTVKVNIIN